MASSAESIATSASDLIEQEGGLQPFLKNIGFGGIMYAIILQVIDMVRASGLVLLGPVRALGKGLITLIDMTIVNMLSVFDAGTQASVQSFTDGIASFLGPLAQPASVGTMMISLFVFMWFIDRLSIHPLAFMRSLRS